jgi:hypothetical protein
MFSLSRRRGIPYRSPQTGVRLVSDSRQIRAGFGPDFRPASRYTDPPYRIS